MQVIETKVKKWGNSLAIVIPSEAVERGNIKENQNIKILIPSDSQKAFRETFGMGKGKLTKTAQQFKDELRAELYP